MEINEILKQQILEIVDNQMNANDPQETNSTFNRLIKQGYSDSDAKILIAQCVSVEIFEVMKNGEPFKLERYVANLNRLPKEPFD